MGYGQEERRKEDSFGCLIPIQQINANTNKYEYNKFLGNDLNEKRCLMKYLLKWNITLEY